MFNFILPMLSDYWKTAERCLIIRLKAITYFHVTLYKFLLQTSFSSTKNSKFVFISIVKRLRIEQKHYYNLYGWKQLNGGTQSTLWYFSPPSPHSKWKKKWELRFFSFHENNWVLLANILNSLEQKYTFLVSFKFI